MRLKKNASNRGQLRSGTPPTIQMSNAGPKRAKNSASRRLGKCNDRGTLVKPRNRPSASPVAAEIQCSRASLNRAIHLALLQGPKPNNIVNTSNLYRSVPLSQTLHRHQLQRPLTILRFQIGTSSYHTGAKAQISLKASLARLKPCPYYKTRSVSICQPQPDLLILWFLGP
jgi:hypothetical protein